MLRRVIPLKVFTLDIARLKPNPAAEACGRIPCYDTLSYKNFGRLLGVLGYYLGRNRYLADRTAREKESSVLEVIFDDHAVAKASELMIAFQKMIWPSPQFTKAFHKIEKEISARANQFRNYGQKITMSIEELGLVYSYIALHPNPTVACEFIANTLKNHLGSILIQIRMHTVGLDHMIDYSSEQLKAGRVTPLMESFTPWKTKEYEGRGSLVEELLSRFGQEWVANGMPDKIEPWGKPLFELVKAHKLVPVLLSLVEGDSPISPEGSMLAAKILNLYPNRYSNHLAVIRKLGKVGKNKGVSVEELPLAEATTSEKSGSPKKVVEKKSPFEVLLEKFMSGAVLEGKDEKGLLSEIGGTDVAKLMVVLNELSDRKNLPRRALILKVLRLRIHHILVDHRQSIRQKIPDLMRNLSLNEIASMKLTNTARVDIKEFTTRKKRVDYAAELLFDTNLERSQKNRELYFQILNYKIENQTEPLDDETQEFLRQFLISLLETSQGSLRTLSIFLKALAQGLIDDDFFYIHMSKFLEVPNRPLEDEEIAFFLESDQILRSNQFASLDWSLTELGWIKSGQEAVDMSRAVRRDRSLKNQDSRRKRLFEVFSSQAERLSRVQERELRSTSDAKGMRVVQIFARANHLLLQDVSDVYKMGYDFILVDPASRARYHVELKTCTGDNNLIHVSPNQIKVASDHLRMGQTVNNGNYSILIVRAGGFLEGGIKELVWVKSPDLESITGSPEQNQEGATISLNQLFRSAESVERYDLQK